MEGLPDPEPPRLPLLPALPSARPSLAMDPVKPVGEAVVTVILPVRVKGFLRVGKSERLTGWSPVATGAGAWVLAGACGAGWEVVAWGAAICRARAST